MAEFNSAENLNMNLAENFSTDVMTGGLDERMFLYFRLSSSMKKADGVDIIVSFLMESGVKMILKDLDHGKLSRHYAAVCFVSDQKEARRSGRFTFL